MKKQDTGSSIVSAIMEAVGLSSRKKLAQGGVRSLGMNGAIGNGRVRHCSTWDLGYKLPRGGSRTRFDDFNGR